MANLKLKRQIRWLCEKRMEAYHWGIAGEAKAADSRFGWYAECADAVNHLPWLKVMTIPD